MTAKPLALLAAAALAALGTAQTWSRAYDEGLQAARGGKWAMAREAFQQAAAGRPDDRSGPTVLPGPSTERKVWRNGAPYSPNFLAAYALYRQAVATADPTEQEKGLRSAASELETLVAKDQGSNEAIFYLGLIYTRLNDDGKRKALAEKAAKMGRRDFKVDTEVVAPEELASMGARTSGGAGTAMPTPGSPNPPRIIGPTAKNGTILQPVNATVAPMNDKFALVVGQSNSHVPGGNIPYASTDAERVRNSLVDFSGYPAENVTLLQNVPAADIRAAASALAAKLTEGATVFVFYAGAGVHVDGKDYLAGAETELAGDVSSMVAKTDLFQPLIVRGARIFSFFEVNRPMDANGGYFGREEMRIGQISEVESTIPGDVVTPIYREGQAVGTFVNAFALSLANIRSNQIPIYNFVGLLFDSMRRGDSGISGGGARQTCTLPRLWGLAADSKF